MQTIIVDKNGLQGTLANEEALSNADTRQLLVNFHNGQKALVSKELLTRHDDGRYYLDIGIEELLAGQEGLEDDSLVIPVTQETLSVRKRAVETGVVEIHKRVHERVEVVDQPLYNEEVEVERVAVNQVVEQPPSVRHEGDTMIIPLLEEVLVVEKRLMLREEVYVRKVRRETHSPQEVRLRNEEVEVVRKDVSSQELRQGKGQTK